MIDFIGKLHPLFVHLPIGMIIVSFILDWLGELNQFSQLKNATKFILAIALISSALSLGTGYILSLDEANESSSIDLHKWFAIGTSVFLLIQLNLWSHTIKSKIIHHTMMVFLLILLSITGHLGGELTHGRGYLSFNEPKVSIKENDTPPINNIQEAMVYNDVTKYIIKEKCESCHGAERQKGKLRLDEIDYILKGGKSGNTIDLNEYPNSEFIKRILLNESDEHHMPPKKETQLTLNEVKILEWWVLNKCVADKRFSSFTYDSSFNVTLHNYLQERNSKATKKEQLKSTVSAISEIQKKQLLELGLMVTPIATNDNHIRVTAFNVDTPTKKMLTALEEVKDQLVELKMGNCFLNDESVQFISTFSSLEKLWIDNTTISDKGLVGLKNLNRLIYLNISGNKVTSNGLKTLLANNPGIKKLIAYDVNLGVSEKEELKKMFKGEYLSIGIDTMQYETSDTLFKKKTN